MNINNNIIKYNDVTIPKPTPLVTLSQNNISYNKDWGKDYNINLQGQLTGDYTGIRIGQSGLLNIFNKNFGNLDIYQYTGNSLEYQETITSYTANPSSLLFTGLSGKYLRSKNSKTYIELEVDGCYGGWIVDWSASNNNATWDSFLLYKNNYYGLPIAPCVPNHGVPFNRLYFFPQVPPTVSFFRTCAQAVAPTLATASNSSLNALGTYTGIIENYSYLRIGVAGAGGGTPLVKLFISGIDGENIYTKSGIVINSISFDESHYNGILNYTIDLNSFEYSGNVIEPRNEFAFSENTNKTLNLNHTVSARGINTNLSNSKSNALSNAINFVRSYTGLNNVPNTNFVSGYNKDKLFLQNISESIDRLNGFYQIEEQYRSDLVNTGLAGILNYTLDISSGANLNSVEINIRGEYKGPLYGNTNTLKTTLDLYGGVTGLIPRVYSGYFNPIPIQYTVNQNTGNNLISFDYLFDNINLPNPYFKYSASTSRDALDQICSVQVRGDMIARGNLNYRSGLMDVNLINLTGQMLTVASGALSGFKDFNNITTQSNLRLLNISVEKNFKEGKLSASANYDDKFLPTGGFSDANYSISIDAPIWYMNNNPVCNINNFHIINDFDITTLPKLNINTNAQIPNASTINEGILKSNIINITNKIIPTEYNFDIKLQDSYNISKKYQNLNSVSNLTYNLNKIDIRNQTGLLPKFNT
jgi:hypothetical protein